MVSSGSLLPLFFFSPPTPHFEKQGRHVLPPEIPLSLSGPFLNTVINQSVQLLRDPLPSLKIECGFPPSLPFPLSLSKVTRLCAFFGRKMLVLFLPQRPSLLNLFPSSRAMGVEGLPFFSFFWECFPLFFRKTPFFFFCRLLEVGVAQIFPLGSCPPPS